MSDELMLHLERTFPVPTSTAWQIVTDPELLAKWWGPRGFTNVVEEWDLRVGGTYRITMRPPGGDEFHLRGEFREVVQNERLVYTFVWEEPDPDDFPNQVTVALAARNHATFMTIDHGPFKNEARRAPPRGGWTEGLKKLEELLTSSR